MACKGVYYERELLVSKACKSLTGTARAVLDDFMMKRRLYERNARKKGRSKQFAVVNNGEITYTYSEAEKKGLTRPRFGRALKELHEKGFIDITKHGGAYDGDKNLYALSQRWEKWNTPEFDFVPWPKDHRRGIGWSAHHEKKRREEEKKVILLSSRKRQIVPRPNRQIISRGNKTK